MNRIDFLRSMTSPLPNAVLKKYPAGNIRQFWSENPSGYSSAFGKTDPVHMFLAGHTGVDIATFQGDTVVAAHEGTVVAIDNDPTHAGGRNLKLESDPLDDKEPGDSKVQTVYCHLDQILVSEGQRVTKGQLIGLEGNTGFVISGGTEFWGNAPAGKGVHLHFGLYELVRNGPSWVMRFNNPLNGSTDPIPWLTSQGPNDIGEAGGWIAALQNILSYLRFKRGG